jgi:alpha-beta hydrolase superfamily lysophospholipase
MKAIVIISHGLYEHSLRYYSLASALTSNNYAVYAMDHYAHGKSDGQLGLLDDYSILHLDFIEFIKQIQLQNPGIPVFLFCHSMGTLVGLLAVSSLQNIHAVIFSGTALFIGPDSGSPFGLRFLYPLTLTDFAKILTKFLAELDPNGPAAPILDSGITSDEKELNLLKKDARQIHKWVVNKTAYEMLKMIEAAKKAVSLFNLPTLIIHGEKDEIALPVGSLFIYNNSKTLEADKRIKIFPGLKHEIIHEKMPDQQQVLDTCVEFFDYYYSKLQLSP